MATNVFVGWKLLGSQMRIRVAPLMRARKSSEFLSLKPVQITIFLKLKSLLLLIILFPKSFDVFEKKFLNQQK